MGKSNNVAFRSALSGYNREDVNQYILEMNRSFEERESALRQTADEASARLADVQAERDAAAAQAEEARRAQAEAESVLAALRESMDQLKEEAASLRDREKTAAERASSAQAQLSEAQTMIHALESELTSRPAIPEASEKSQKYDQISAQIGDILINANNSADKIIAAANAEASRIITETEEEAIYIRTRLSDTADEMLQSISANLHVSTENCVTELMTALREMRDSAASLVRDLEARSQELDAKIEYYQTNVSETIEKSLSDMDEKYGIRQTKTASAGE